MAREVTRKGGGAVADIKSYAHALATGIEDSHSQTVIPGGQPLLRLIHGEWVFGQQNEPVQEGSSWAVNIGTLRHGWQCWVKDNPKDEKSKQTLKGEIFTRMDQSMPPMPDPIEGKSYDPARSVEMKCIDGDDAGTTVLYKTNSVGGTRNFFEFTTEIRKQCLEDPEHAFPVIHLGVDHYMHKAYGKTYIPIFEIVDWVTMDLVATDDADGDGIDPDALVDELDTAVDDNEAQPEPQSQPSRRRVSEPAAAAAASQANSRKKAPLVADKVTPKAAAPAPTAAARTGQRRRPGR